MPDLPPPHFGDWPCEDGCGQQGMFLVRERLLCPRCAAAALLTGDLGGWMPTGLVRAGNDTGIHEIVRPP